MPTDRKSTKTKIQRESMMDIFEHWLKDILRQEAL